MPTSVEFETPENVSVRYELSGVGTRFVAWVYDMLVIFVAQLVVVVIAIVILLETMAWSPFDETILEPDGYMLGILVLVLGSASLLYFILFEQFMRGQTPGKRSMHIRVVTAEGFSLTFGAVFLRGAFRLIDTIPLLWPVPLVSARGQRFGDMVAGTLVVMEQEANTQGVEMQLAQRDARDALFLFTAAQLQCLDENDFDAIAKYLERKSAAPSQQVSEIGARLTRALTQRLAFTPPPLPATQDRFLEDLLAAGLRKQVSQVG